MSSINPNNINGQYPVAGQDNDSQGFRDNFTNIKNNLNFAKLEIEELQSKALLTTPLSGVPLNNDLQNTPLAGAQLLRTTEKINPIGPSGTDVNVDWSTGPFQYFELTGNAAVTLDFSAIGAGFYTKVRLMVIVNNPTSYNTITLSHSGDDTFIGLDNVLGGSSVNNTIKFTKVGRYVYDFSVYDTTAVYVEQVLVSPYEKSITLQYDTNANANVITVTTTTETLVVDPLIPMTQVTANIVMPANTAVNDGHTINFAFGNTITSITHYGGNATIVGGLTTANVNIGASFIYMSAPNKWFRLR